MVSYDLHITKADHWLLSESNPVTEDDLNKVADLLAVYEEIPFVFQTGRVTLCGADKIAIGLMIEIATRINARVQGDDGEFYDNMGKSFPPPPDLHIASVINNISNYPLPDNQQNFIKNLGVGDEIEHPEYGRGKICGITGEGIDTEFKVTFRNGEIPKRLLAYFAPIKPC